MKAQWQNPEKQPFQIHDLWAKYDCPNGTYHPLAYHLLDIGAVAAQLWDLVLSPAQKTHLQKLLGLDDKPARQQLVLLAGLHDIGKATPAFQQKAPGIYQRLRSSALHEKYPNKKPHGTMSAAILNSWLSDKGISKMQANLASAAALHTAAHP